MISPVFESRRSLHSIAKELGVRTPTVVNVCNNWLKHGVVEKKKRGSLPRKLPDEITEAIISLETLKHQRFLSLK